MQLPIPNRDSLLQLGTWAQGKLEAIWLSSDGKYWVFCRIDEEHFFCCPLDRTRLIKEYRLAPGGR